MLENRSFDHYLGWLAADEEYVAGGRRRYGRSFGVDARLHERYRAPGAGPVATIHVTELEDEANPYRGCLHTIPAHGWETGRLERDHGFLAAGTDNDRFALGYYLPSDLPVLAPLAKRYTVLDRYHASLLGPTFPNRMYFHSAQSEGRKDDPGPLRVGLFGAETIWDRLAAAGVPATYYYADLPLLLLWGERMNAYVRGLDRYFADAAAGALANGVVVDPAFGGHLRTDDHPRGDVHAGGRYLLEVFAAFAQSAQWERGAFVVTYDEWGGFFDHVAPPVLPDDRESSDDADNFGQAGFRVPAVLASPYAHRGFVDHRVYDHTSILRFLEWRFLGAPPRGPGADSATWFLTQRDRYANNIGASLRPGRPEPEVGVTVEAIPQPSSACDPADLVAQSYPGPTLTPWLDKPRRRHL